MPCSDVDLSRFSDLVIGTVCYSQLACTVVAPAEHVAIGIKGTVVGVTTADVVEEVVTAEQSKGEGGCR